MVLIAGYFLAKLAKLSGGNRAVADEDPPDPR